MNEMKSHIFVRHPDRKIVTCWSCASRKEDHKYTVYQSMLVLTTAQKSRKKGNARSARSKTTGMRAVR